MSAPDRPPITPRLTVAELLRAFPELEEVLIGLAPPFAKLRNPVLRRTVARVTTLERAAAVGGVPLRELMLRLREAAGQPKDLDTAGAWAGPGDEPGAADVPPDWVRTGRATWTVDADALLERGEQPLHEVVRRARELAAGEVGRIRSSFLPAPLLDALARQGYRTVAVRGDGGVTSYVSRPAP